MNLQSYDKAFPNRSAFAVLNNDTWVAVNIGISASNANAIEVDLSALGGKAPAAIKYAWGDNAGKPNGGDVVCCAAAGQAGKQKEVLFRASVAPAVSPRVIPAADPCV